WLPVVEVQCAVGGAAGQWPRPSGVPATTAPRSNIHRGRALGRLEQKRVEVADMSTAEDDEQDLTRKQRREQARTQRKELEQAELASAVRRTRLIQLGIVVGIVVAIIVAVVLATGGGSKKGLASPGKGTEQVVK